MPILTGLLSPDVYGSAALAATLISLLSVFALAGVDVSYVRAYQNKNDHNPDAVEAYAWRFALALGLAAPLRAGVYATLGTSVVQWDASTSLGLALAFGALVLLPLASPAVRRRVLGRSGEVSDP